MRKLLLYSIMLAGFGSGCQQNNANAPKDCIAVRYVRGLCGQAVLQIQDPRHYAKGETIGNEEHVFLAGLECGVNEQALRQQTFYVQLDPENFNSYCAFCMAAISYEGERQYKVRLVSSCESVIE